MLCLESCVDFMGFLSEVMKGLMAKKQAKLKKNQPESAGKPERMREMQYSGLDIEVKRDHQVNPFYNYHILKYDIFHKLLFKFR